MQKSCIPVLFWSANKNEVLFTKSPMVPLGDSLPSTLGTDDIFQDVWVWFFLFNQMISLTGTVICFILIGESDQYTYFILITKTLPFSIGAKYQILWICLNTADARVIRNSAGSRKVLHPKWMTREIEGAILICAWTRTLGTLLYFILITSSSWILG